MMTTFCLLTTLKLIVIFSFDYLDIRNDKRYYFGAYCGGPKRKDANVEVTGNYVRLQFHSDSDIQKKGFLLYFSTSPLPSKYKQFKTFTFFKTFSAIMFDGSSGLIVSGLPDPSLIDSPG